jgi:hypothetical protein
VEDSNQHKAQAAIHRRSVLKSIAGFAAASALNPSLTGLAQPQPGVKSINPKWYGFNLLEYFSSDKDWMQHFPYNGDGQFRGGRLPLDAGLGLQLGPPADGLPPMDGRR